MYEIYNDDCLNKLKDIKDKSIDLVLIDPPYNIGKDKKWDKWKTVNAYVEFMGEVFKECQRILKDNGSFYFFHNDFLQIVELQNYINKNTDFVFKSIITWDKLTNADRVQFSNLLKMYGNQRNYFKGLTEYCLYYTFQDETGLSKVMLDVNNFKSLREYSKNIQEYIGLKLKQINTTLGHRRAEHFFYHSSSQWGLPTKETYNELIEVFNIDKYEGFRTYEELRQEYEELRYTFNQPEVDLKGNDFNELKDILRPYTTLHNYSRPKNNYKLGHITPKPVEMLEHIIKTSSTEGDVVLDCFMGSGSTGVACLNTNRRFIGIEKEEKYFNIAKDRLKEASKEQK